MSTNYAAILSRRYQGKSWALDGDSFDGLNWLDSSPKPTKAELDALWPEVEAEIQAEVQARADARVSALAKLAALGLDEAEVKALLG